MSCKIVAWGWLCTLSPGVIPTTLPRFPGYTHHLKRFPCAIPTTSPGYTHHPVGAARCHNVVCCLLLERSPGYTHHFVQVIPTTLWAVDSAGCESILPLSRNPKLYPPLCREARYAHRIVGAAGITYWFPCCCHETPAYTHHPVGAARCHNVVCCLLLERSPGYTHHLMGR